MLYSGSVMNNKSIFPESVHPGKHHSLRADFKLNAWAFVAVAFAIVSRIGLRHHADWPLLSRAIIALSPLLPSLLYIRSIGGWIRGMDELQRRIQLEACLFATIGTIFITTAYNLLIAQGIYIPRLPHGLDWEDTFASTILFYILGNFIFNRRYK